MCLPRVPAVVASIVSCLAALIPSCAPAPDPNRIVIWHQMRVDERLVLAAQLKQYTALKPGVTVEEIYKETEELRSGFIVAAIAGQGPDLVYGPSDMVGPFEVMGIIAPLEPLFEKEELDLFLPAALTWYRGHLYQVADKLGNHLTLIYNRDIIQSPPRTDEELVKLGQQIARDHDGDGKPDRYALAWNYTEPFFFIPFLTGFGGWVMTEDGTPTLDTPANVNALRFIRDLRDRYHVVPGEADYNIADILFKDGKAAMIINGDWSWAGYRKAGLNFGVAPLPSIVSTGLWCAPMISPKGYSLNINVPESKRRRIVDLLRYLLSVDVQLQTARELLTLPTRREAVASEFVRTNDIMKNSLLQIERGKTMPVVPELRAIWDAMRPAYQAVLGGARTPEEAAHDMQALAIRKIREMNE
jgi:maltose-binding protein MalE